MEALDLFSAPQRRQTLDVSDDEVRTVEWVCCDTRVRLTDIERALLRLSVDRLPPRYCTKCDRRMVVLASTPPRTTKNCPFCDKPIPDDNNLRGVVLIANTGFWAHITCMVSALGHRTATQGWHTRMEHPDCARCGDPWDEHQSWGYTGPDGVTTRSCPDGDGPQLYERAPGLVGVQSPEWVVQA